MARIDDMELLINLAVATREDWYSPDVQLEAVLDIPATGAMAHGLVLRYEDDENYILVLPNRGHSWSDRVFVWQVIGGQWYQLSSHIVPITWTAGGTDSLRVRLEGTCLCVDVKPDGADTWTENVERCLVTLTTSAQHGVGLLATGTPMICTLSYSVCPTMDLSTVGVWQQLIYIPGTLAANQILRYVTPFACQILHLSAVQSNAGSGTVKLGHSGDDDYYLQNTAMGQSNVPVTRTAPTEFRYGVTPTIPAGTTVVITVDYDGPAGTAAQNVTIAVTFRSI